MTEKDLKAYKKAFGENLKKIRTNKYSTLSKLDADTNFDASNYHKYEKGDGNPTLETIVQIAADLKIHPKELFEFDFNFKNVE